jgi:hypothetical protein
MNFARSMFMATFLGICRFDTCRSTDKSKRLFAPAQNSRRVGRALTESYLVLRVPPFEFDRSISATAAKFRCYGKSLEAET